MASRKTLAFTLREVGAIEGSGGRKDESDWSLQSLWGMRAKVRRPGMPALVQGSRTGLDKVVRRGAIWEQFHWWMGWGRKSVSDACLVLFHRGRTEALDAEISE